MTLTASVPDLGGAIGRSAVVAVTNCEGRGVGVRGLAIGLEVAVLSPLNSTDICVKGRPSVSQAIFVTAHFVPGQAEITRGRGISAELSLATRGTAIGDEARQRRSSRGKVICSRTSVGVRGPLIEGIMGRGFW